MPLAVATGAGAGGRTAIGPGRRRHDQRDVPALLVPPVGAAGSARVARSGGRGARRAG
jgi:hypothetical protein